MSEKAVTIYLPEAVYNEFQQKAQRHRSSVEREIAETVVTAASSDWQLSSELQGVLRGLDFLADDDLWRAARSHLPSESAEALAELNFKQQSAGLTPTEKEQQSTLLRAYDRYMLVRAKSAALLKERGHDIAVLLKSA